METMATCPLLIWSAPTGPPNSLSTQPLAGPSALGCDGKTLRGSALEAEDGSHRFGAQVTIYARALGVALAQTSYDSSESSERATLKELLSTLELEGVLIQKPCCA